MLKKILAISGALLLVTVLAGPFVNMVSAAGDGLNANLIVPIGELKSFSEATIPVYITTIYQWGIGAAALLAVLMLVVGGLQYVLAAGNLGTTEAAKQRMSSAVLGVALLLGISLILSTLDPKLTFIQLGNPLKNRLVATNAQGSAASPLTFDFSTPEALDELEDALDGLEDLEEDGRIGTNAFKQSLGIVTKQFNEYFDSEAYRAKVTETATKAAQKSGSAPPTKEDIDKKIKEDKDSAWETITDDVTYSFHYSDPPEKFGGKKK